MCSVSLFLLLGTPLQDENFHGWFPSFQKQKRSATRSFPDCTASERLAFLSSIHRLMRIAHYTKKGCNCQICPARRSASFLRPAEVLPRTPAQRLPDRIPAPCASKKRFKSRLSASISSTAFIAWSDAQSFPRLVAHMSLKKPQAGLAVCCAFKLRIRLRQNLVSGVTDSAVALDVRVDQAA